MAEKRRLDAVGPVVCSKLPRLEADPSHVHAAGLCRAGVLPGHVSDGHYSYQGTYFSYPWQCHESPELSAHWSPAEPYASCTDGALSQHPRTEKTRCLLSRQESRGLGTWAQSYETRKDCLVGEKPAAPEKWANYRGQVDFIQQGWIQGLPMLPPSRVPMGCPPLVAPKPVYQNHIYCTDTSCSPKGSPASGMPSRSPSKQLTKAEWTLPSSGQLANASCGSTGTSKAPVAGLGFLPFHQSWKEAAPAPAGFPPYHQNFEHLQVASSGSLVDTSYPTECTNRKNFPEACARSPKPPPPGSPLAAPQGLIYQERASACYSLPAYPLTPHQQLVLYQQSVAQAEKQNAVFALPACRSFNFPAGEDPPLLPRTCLPPAPQNYYPGHPESYFYHAPLVASPSLKASRGHETRQNSQSKVSFEQKDPVSACSMSEKASRSSSAPSREGVRGWAGAEVPVKRESESFWGPRATPEPRAFQSLHSVEGLPSCIDGYKQMQEACGTDSGLLGKGCSRREGPSYAEKQSGDKMRDASKTLQSGACIVIPDSPVASHDACLKGDLRRTRISEHSDSPVHCVRQSPGKEPRDLKQAEAPPPPSSPPMPVIHNVFSLAPYQEYLEGAAVSLHLPPSKACPAEKPSSEKSWPKVEGTTSPRPSSTGSSKTPGTLQDWGEGTACNAVAEGGRKHPSSSCTGMQKESGDSAGFCDAYQAHQNAPETSWQGPTGPASEFTKDDRALDLSLKTEGFLDMLLPQRPAGKPEALETSESHGENVPEGPAKVQQAIRDTLQKSSPEEKSNFQSSAAFLYKKFKILKSHAAGLGPALPRNLSLIESSSQTGPLAGHFSLQRDAKQAATQQNRMAVQSSQQVACQPSHLPVQPSCQQVATQQSQRPVHQDSQWAVTQQNHWPVQPSCKQAATQQNCLSVQQSSQWVVIQQHHLPVQQSCQLPVTQQSNLPVQQSSQQVATQQNSLHVQQSGQQVATHQNSLHVQQSGQQVATHQNSLHVQQSGQQVATHQNSLHVQQSGQQVATHQNSLHVQQSGQQVATHQNSLHVQQSGQQVATQQNSLHVQQSGQQVATQQNSLHVQQSGKQVTTRQNSLPVQQSCQQLMTRRNSLPALHIAHEKPTKPDSQRSSRKYYKQPSGSKLLPPAGLPALGEGSASLLPGFSSPTDQASAKRHFTAVHASLCAAISDSVSTSSPEQLREWREKTEPERDSKPKVASSSEAKGRPKTPETPRPSEGRQVWLAFKDTARLLNQLQSRLEDVSFTRKCPFPHVVRAGTIFVPIHVVKEQLFDHLPGPAVDHILQAHKVELRPTTLSEEKLLRELGLKTCPSRLLKLLAWKQLPDIYPDLLDRHWHHCVEQQLGSSSQAGLQASK
ncbi:uncharacterized protein C15orf39 homolog isoform X3 [Paroedura picta]|uniref:uncharacterized protein C15orf39 homolog isoform X2 n=1 Tax=Paroedura picta TaxID=143630 RepID=UPI0040572FA3